LYAVVAEGFEAGGHNGREETTMVLVPLVCESVQVPVIAAEVLLQAGNRSGDFRR